MGLPPDSPLMVVGFDMDFVLVMDGRALRVGKARWRDVELVESELAPRESGFRRMDDSRRSRAPRRYRPMYGGRADEGGRHD